VSGPARPGPPAGLCDHCAFQRLVPTRRTVFSMCGRHRDDPRFPRYPPVPVARCVGFTPREPPAPPA
jgi:hypothetical protein